MKKKDPKPEEAPAPRAALAPDALKVLPPLTENQAKCLQFILNFFAEHRFYPTQREMAEAMNIKSNTAEMYVAPLVQKGYLQREPVKQRNIRLTSDGLERLRMMGVDVHDRLDAA
jgi:Mn-dependent DtxR family transcriptional regulator